jgi:PAS domain S-box-containing protein
MKKNPNKPKIIRTEAESYLAVSPPNGLPVRSAEELLQELKVHQIELEMQNEQLRQSQVELEQSRDRYVDFYDFAPVGYITLNRGGMIDEINLTGAEMLGGVRNTLLHLRLANFVAAEDRDRWHRYFFDVLKRDYTVACELTFQHDGGLCFYARLDSLCLKIEGKESVVRVVLTDARLEKNHRQALKEIEYQKFALDQHSIVAITDVKGAITYVNDKFCTISQYSRDELLGQNHRLINSGNHPKAFFHDMYHTISAGKVWHGDICNRAKDGSLYWVATTIVPNLENNGKPFQYVAIRTDISERNRIKQELMVLNNQLTHEVTKRTADLSALTAHVQNVAELERANLARELHDELGSTLVGINMEVRRLSGKNTAPDILQDLSLIKKLLLNANEIKQNVINQLYPTVLDTLGFTAAIEWLVLEYRQHSGLTVGLDIQEEEIVMEHAFSLAAYRITQECLTNIAKHAEASKVQIKVKANDGFLDMTIDDNGIGLSSGINIGGISKGGHGIFGMIERARYLGGSLEFGRGKKNGTIAHLILPIAEPKPLNRKRVLVVDDHAIVRDALRQRLNDQTDDFFVAGEAADGIVAIQMATEEDWDIMLLDINLPKTNGLKVLEKVLAIKPGMPIIMLSGLEKRKYGKIALAKGAKCYIEKSETDNLVEAMRSATIGR